MKKSICIVSLVVFVIACAPVSKQTKEILKQPVSCSTAEADLKVIKEDKASAGKRIWEGFSSILPISIIINLVRGTYTDKIKVAAGKYNKMIDQKVADIEEECGITKDLKTLEDI
jgi:hypothetical protein